jgi:hypothetical protein
MEIVFKLAAWKTVIPVEIRGPMPESSNTWGQTVWMFDHRGADFGKKNLNVLQTYHLVYECVTHMCTCTYHAHTYLFFSVFISPWPQPPLAEHWGLAWPFVFAAMAKDMLRSRSPKRWVGLLPPSMLPTQEHRGFSASPPLWLSGLMTSFWHFCRNTYFISLFSEARPSPSPLRPVYTVAIVLL